VEDAAGACACTFGRSRYMILRHYTSCILEFGAPRMQVLSPVYWFGCRWDSSTFLQFGAPLHMVRGGWRGEGKPFWAVTYSITDSFFLC